MERRDKMKVGSLDRQTFEVFKPVQVLVTVETQEDYDALMEHEECVSVRSYKVGGVTEEAAKRLLNLVDNIFYHCSDGQT